jgi:hypothetical protein
MESMVRAPRLVWFRALTIVSLAVMLAADAAAINLNLTQEDIDRALVLARSTDRERARFHEQYIHRLDNPTVQSVEIVTEFRRMVLIAEERILRGDRAFAYSTRLAAEALKPWKDRVSIVARLRFHPLNTYVTVPDVEVLLDGPNAEAAFVGVLKEPQYAMTVSPGEQAALVGATIEGVFEASRIGQTERTVVLRLDGKPLAVVGLDFAEVE